jgi:hypothetical protein
MAQIDEINISQEKQFLEDNYRDSLNELRKISWFIKLFIKMNKERKNIYDKREEEKDKKIDTSTMTNSFLFISINNIYKSFESFIDNSHNFMLSMENDLLKPLDDFIDNQLNFYNKNLNKMKYIYNDYLNNKSILDNSKNNYYHSSYESNQSDVKEIKNSIFRGENDVNTKRDNFIRNKMIARNDEFIYKYEVAKYNKNIAEYNDEYNLLIDNILNLEKTKVHFVNSLLNKFKKYLNDYVKMINNFINEIDKFSSKEIGDQEIKLQSKYFTKYRDEKKDKKESRIPKINYMSYQSYLDKYKPNNEQLSSLKDTIINPRLKLDENALNGMMKEFVNNLLEENDIGQEKVANIFELLYYPNYDAGKKLLNYLNEKRGMSSIVFLNLKNLEYLANILGFISLHENDVFKEQFELNLKIIFIAERIFYKKKITNDKIYLSALLSKNRYYRTKQFWRNIVELKLANKLDDHIDRLKNLKIKDKQKKGRFSNWFYSDSKKSFLAKTRIVKLIKNYDSLDSEQIELIEKMASQEMQTIIRENIPIFANFNFPSELCLDLIAELTEEYRVGKDNIKFFVTYFNVSNYTIRKLIPNEKGNSINIYKQFVSISEINKKLKLFKNIVPFLNFKDYNNLLLCSKLFHKKLSKTIYKYILKQKNLSPKIRLSIWHNILGISALKKEYNYKEVLSKANEEKVKHEIELDVIRTTVGDVENPEETRAQITNVLYAVSQLNGKTKYCQGMNFIVQFLYEKFGEEEAFYIFLSFFKNTDYKLIFEKDLEELKILFYVFRRVISLLEPELSSYFNRNAVDVNFFVPPWFITLYTSSHQNFKGENDNSQILLRILDNFIVSGLKSLMEVGCVALHSYENVLMSKRYEDMMQFLINDMLRSDFFSKKNTEFVENFFNETKISKKLVKNIEEEFRQEQKFKTDKK